MFLFKKIVGLFCYPLSICVEILVIGVFALWMAKKQRMAKLVMTLGVVLFTVLSYGGFTSPLLTPLEARYPPLVDMSSLNGVKWLAVYGGGQIYNPQRPANSQLACTSLSRLVEGIRIYKALGGTKLILSGGAVYGPVSEAEILARTAQSMGVDKRDILLDEASKDTEDQAEAMKKIVGAEPFILVTSASHMPRSVGLCKKLGMRPIPAPTDYMLGEVSTAITPHSFFPSVDHLQMCQKAMHEYMGLAWSKLRGRI